MSYQVKYNYNGEFRRSSMEKLDMSSVKNTARKLFSIPNSEKIVLTWVDEEGDEVLVSSPPEFEEFLRFHGASRRPPTLVKFGVLTAPKPNIGLNTAGKRSETFEGDISSDSANSGKEPRKDVKEKALKGRVVHRGVACNSCGCKPIEGIRYKCAGRDDYNLCSACEATTEHPFPMLMMAEPRVGARLRLKGRGFGPNINRRYADGDLPLPPAPPQGGPAIHNGIACAKCHIGPIVGLRYKCTGRDAYDLCENCEASDKHTYPLIKIYRPDPTIFVKDWGTGGEVRPANPFGLKHFSAPVNRKEPNGQRAAKMLDRKANGGVHRGMNAMLRFAGDVTVPDGTAFSPSVEFTKTWLVRNDGTCDWGDFGIDARLVPNGGDLMCNPGLAIPVQCLKAGEETQLSVNLKAPCTPGRYVAYFRIQGGDGIFFGQKLWVDIIVRLPTAAVGDVGLSPPAFAAVQFVDAAMPAPAPLPEDSTEHLADECREEVEFIEEDFDIVYPGAAPDSIEDTALAQETEEMERLWKVELDALKGMGFNDTRLNLQLLNEHTRFSYAQYPEMHGRPFSDSMSVIIDALVK